jgi:phage shock protein PspC (stress-responsive transcriptional regulator)
MTSTPHSDSPYTATPHTAIPSAPRPELRRVRSGAMLGGVSGGLAAYTGIDTVLWRAAFVALTLAGGAGLVLYAVLWVLTPPVPLGPGEQARPVDLAVERLAGRLSGDRAASPRD